MPKTSKVNIDKWDFTVSEKPLIHREEIVPSYKLIIRDDTDKLVSVMKRTYGVVQNRHVIELAEETFQDSSFNLGRFDRKVITSKNDSRMLANYSFEKTLEVNADDHHRLSLTVINSHDGSYPVMLAVGSIRLVCWNQMKSIRKGLVITGKHTNKLILDDFKITLSLALEQAAEMMGVYQKMSQIELSQERGEKLVKRMVEKRLVSERVSKNVLDIWKHPRHAEDDARNVYNLLNAFTDYSTHQLGIERFELSEKLTSNATNFLAQVDRQQIDSLLGT